TTTTTTVTVRHTARTLKRTLPCCWSRLIRRARERLAARRRSCSRRRRSSEVSCSKALSDWEMLCRILLGAAPAGARAPEQRVFQDSHSPHDLGSSRSRIAPAQEAPSGPGGGALKPLKPACKARIRCDREGARKPPPNQLGVEKAAAEED